MARGNDTEDTDGEDLPAYAAPEDPVRRPLHKVALGLGVAAVILAIAGDLLIADHGGQAVVLLVLAAVASVAAIILNRSSARRAQPE
jgi:drug/metabolite transporter (DMT)-like permease